MFKNQGSPCFFLSSRGQKIKNITKIERTGMFVYIFGFVFYGVSLAKTDLLNKYNYLTLWLAHFFDKIIY